MEWKNKVAELTKALNTTFNGAQDHQENSGIEKKQWTLQMRWAKDLSVLIAMQEIQLIYKKCRFYRIIEWFGQGHSLLDQVA